ncbi:hypothetical protein AaE_008829, partial [Aphanomyces astaci]
GVRNVKTELVSWQGDNPNLAKGRKDVAFSKTYVDVGHQLTRAQREMNAYFGTDEATRRLPMLGSLAVPAQPMQPVATSTGNTCAEKRVASYIAVEFAGMGEDIPFVVASVRMRSDLRSPYIAHSRYIHKWTFMVSKIEMGL